MGMNESSPIAVISNDVANLTPKSALSKLRLNPPSVIILHSNGDDNSALVFIKNLKQDEQLKNVPILLVGENQFNIPKDFAANPFEVRGLPRETPQETAQKVPEELPGKKLKNLKAKVKLKAQDPFRLETEAIQAEIKKITKKVDDTPKTTIEARNEVLFNQMFKNKIKVVIEPLFKKYESMIVQKRDNTIVDMVINQDVCEFSLIKGDVASALSVRHNGSKADVNVIHFLPDNKKIKRSSVEIMNLDFKKLSQILIILIDDFEKYYSMVHK